MKLRLLAIALVVVLPVQAAGAQEPAGNGAGGTGIVSAPMANVREEPEPKAPIATQVLLADEVRILEKKDYRLRIAIPSQGNREGWIQQEAVQLLKDRGRAYFRSDRAWIVITAPKTPALVLDKLGNHHTSLYAGTRLPVVERMEDGYKVQFPDRSMAVIPAADAAILKLRNPVIGDADPAEIVQTARKFIGSQYLSGGITVQGLDTRGLVYTAYRVHGIDLDTDQTALSARAIKVLRKDLRTGDILSFAGGGSGLFIGNGQFLHAPRKGTLQIVGIHDKRFAGALQYGMRVLGEDPDQRKLPAEMGADEIMLAQIRTAELPLGRRIVYWAGRFLGTPYDTDPLGLYVRTNRIVADEKVDCMYLTFRSVELARSLTPGEAIEQAKALRFITEGTVVDGLVRNYGERFAYGEDMVFSGKWGRNITDELGATELLKGSRGRDQVIMLSRSVLATRKLQSRLQDGDIVYWVKDHRTRSAEEIVAHLSFVHLRSGKVFLIHAAGTKTTASRAGGGAVKEVALADYLRETRFLGAFVTRFPE